MNVDVRGGTGGLTVALGDLSAAAAVLRSEAAAMAHLAARLVAMTASWDALRLLALRPSPDVLAALGRAEWHLLRAAGPAGAAGREVQLGVLAGAVEGAVRGYQAAEAALTASFWLGRDVVMAAAGAAWPVALAGGLGLGGLSLANGVLGTGDPLFDHPWLVGFASGGLPRLVWGALASDPLALGLVSLAAIARGKPWPPRNYESALEVVTALASLAGWLREPLDVRVTPFAGAGGGAPRSLTELIAGQQHLDAPPALVRVVQVPQADGSSAWIVQLPGTQKWGPVAGGNPLDLTSDVRLMARRTSLLTRATAEALDLAMAGAGRQGTSDPVMLVGHSLGGVAAASLASSSEFTRTHQVTHVVTAGAPVARFPVPAQVSVLSLEHRQDAVPHLEGSPNPDRASWVTVTRDVTRDPQVGGRLLGAHEVSEYAETAQQVDLAVRQRANTSLVDWAAGSRPFFAAEAARPAVVRDYAVERVGR